MVSSSATGERIDNGIDAANQDRILLKKKITADSRSGHLTMCKVAVDACEEAAKELSKKKTSHWMIFFPALALFAATALGCGEIHHRHGLASIPRDPLARNFTQSVDHFNDSDTRSFPQRYTVDTTSHVEGGPVFFFLSGEAPMEFFEFQTVQIRAWAAEFKAAYVVLEHRYYGDSWPVNNLLGEQNMKFLSVDQALEDGAVFLRWLRTSGLIPGWSSSTRAVVFGCSYSGALSAWFRFRYPELVVGSVAPSGPVAATIDYTSFYEHFEYSAGPSCSEATRKGMQAVELALARGQTKQLCQAFQCCEGDIAPEDVTYFKKVLVETIGSAPQMSNPPTWGLNKTCALIEDNPGIEAIAAGFFYQNANPDGTASAAAPACTSFSYKAMIASMQLPAPADNKSGSRSWYWQKCTEFGFFKPTKMGIFPAVSLSFISGICADVFEVKNMLPDVQSINDKFHGKHLPSSDVLFTNGLKDPWSLLSITQQEGRVQATTYDAGHCATLIASSDQDPPSLTASRERVKEFLKGLLE
jgi:hypothetical protein